MLNAPPNRVEKTLREMMTTRAGDAGARAASARGNNIELGWVVAMGEQVKLKSQLAQSNSPISRHRSVRSMLASARHHGSVGELCIRAPARALSLPSNR